MSPPIRKRNAMDVESQRNKSSTDQLKMSWDIRQQQATQFFVVGSRYPVAILQKTTAVSIKTRLGFGVLYDVVTLN
jgi:hypothetical protein